MKSLLLAVSLLVLTGQAKACEPGEISFPHSQVCSTLKWITGPSLNQFNSVSIHLNKANLKLSVIPWMVMMGGHEHGSRPVTLSEISPSEYLVEKIYFMGGMQGKWFLKLLLINEKKEVIEEVRTLVEF